MKQIENIFETSSIFKKIKQSFLLRSGIKGGIDFLKDYDILLNSAQKLLYKCMKETIIRGTNKHIGSNFKYLKFIWFFRVRRIFV